MEDDSKKTGLAHERGELDFYQLRLIGYLRDHHFSMEEVPVADVAARAEAALNAFSAAWPSQGFDAASELANETLFAGIGSSEYEALENILEMYFADTFDLHPDPEENKRLQDKLRAEMPGLDEGEYTRDMVGIGFWTRSVLKTVPGLFDGFRHEYPAGVGIDDNRLAESEGVIVSRIKEKYESLGWEVHLPEPYAV